MSYIHSPQFNYHGTRLYPLFRRASSTGNYDSTWIQYFAVEQKNHPFAMLYLNLIENVWGVLARAVYRHGKQFQTVGTLKDAVTEEWDKLQSSYLESLTQSMSNRLCQVMQKFGGPTSY
uniref:Uncharacterized protein n=1 Tax=Caenorhabditis japonica TaxID=281687 RepID=A0A8R1IJT2_CAEJA